MKFSIVTISFNQARFLERAIRSVLDQECADLQYIVVDPGSTDGSRDIIERYRPHIAHVILDPDHGAADGLNRGFALATGDLLGFLNSDDALLPGALRQVRRYFEEHPGTDVVSGDCEIIDDRDRVLRRSHSDRFSLARYAYGTGILIQPSTFFRAHAYRRTRGFNVENRSNWDGELFVEMALAGARFGRCGKLLSQYRIHQTSITGTGKLEAAIRSYRSRMFRHIMRREPHFGDAMLRWAFRVLKYLETPGALQQRLLRGPVYRRAVAQPAVGP